jgi:putative membrane protein
MNLEIIKFIITIVLGIITGIFTGLFPGIHINLICTLILSLSNYLLKFTSPLVLSIFIISMSVTHTFLDSIPSIFLGAPDESQILTALPGHKMLIKGKGKEAVYLTLLGSITSMVLAILLSPIFLKITKSIYPIIKNYIGYILLSAIIILILQTKNKINSIIIFILSGILGYSILNNIKIQNPLFPLLSGLFGFSILLESINQSTKIPKQKECNEINIKKTNIISISLRSTIFGYIASFLPGFGSSQAAIFASKTIKSNNQKYFLILVGGINTVNMILSMITLYALDKARNGSILAISQLLEEYTLSHMTLFFITTIISGSVALVIGIKITNLFSKIIEKINYKKLIISILIIIFIMTILLSKLYGILILITSTALGIYTSKINVSKNLLLGCLIIPVLTYLL